LTFPPPFYLQIPLLKYWDGQPVTYVCTRRSKDPVSEDGVFWSVAFEIVDEELRKGLKGRGGEVLELDKVRGREKGGKVEGGDTGEGNTAGEGDESDGVD